MGDSALPHLIQHCGADFDIDHLDQHIETCTWTGAAGQFSCSIKIRYSTHCYSFEDHDEPLPEGSFRFCDQHQQPRVFCPTRFAYSLELPGILKGLCAKPTSPVVLTPEANWSIYRLKMQSPLEAGANYYVFFRVKILNGNTGLPTEASLFVESAYPRTFRPAASQRMPFGRALERLAKK